MKQYKTYMAKPTEARATQKWHLVDAEGVRPSIFFRWFRSILPLRGWVLVSALLFGVVGTFVYGGLRRDLFPDLTLPSLQLMIQAPGRSAPELELAIAQPVEQTMLGLPGVQRVTSTVQPRCAAWICTGTSEDSAISKKTRMSISSGG